MSAARAVPSGPDVSPLSAARSFLWNLSQSSRSKLVDHSLLRRRRARVRVALVGEGRPLGVRLLVAAAALVLVACRASTFTQGISSVPGDAARWSSTVGTTTPRSRTRSVGAGDAGLGAGRREDLLLPRGVERSLVGRVVGPRVGRGADDDAAVGQVGAAVGHLRRPGHRVVNAGPKQLSQNTFGSSRRTKADDGRGFDHCWWRHSSQPLATYPEQASRATASSVKRAATSSRCPRLGMLSARNVAFTVCGCSHVHPLAVDLVAPEPAPALDAAGSRRPRTAGTSCSGARSASRRAARSSRRARRGSRRPSCVPGHRRP